MDTFVVRVWVPAATGELETDPGIRGVVEHVASGQASAFVGREQLVAFIRANLGLRTRPEGARPEPAERVGSGG